MIVIQKALLSLIAVNSKCSIFSLPQTILPQLNPYNKNFSSQPVIHIHRSTLYLYNINNNSHHHSRQVLNLTVNQALCYALHLHWYINPQHNSLRYLLFPSAYMWGTEVRSCYATWLILESRYVKPGEPDSRNCVCSKLMYFWFFSLFRNYMYFKVECQNRTMTRWDA
jgi:hypothetical protein